MDPTQVIKLNSFKHIDDLISEKLTLLPPEGRLYLVLDIDDTVLDTRLGYSVLERTAHDLCAAYGIHEIPVGCPGLSPDVIDSRGVKIRAMDLHVVECVNRATQNPRVVTTFISARGPPMTNHSVSQLVSLGILHPSVACVGFPGKWNNKATYFQRAKQFRPHTDMLIVVDDNLQNLRDFRDHFPGATLVHYGPPKLDVLQDWCRGVTARACDLV
jgi:hypothetical protein